jgi:very-short-patch-repair endonuclease
MNFDELRKRCESEIERHLLGALYPELGPDAQKEIQAQYIIDYYDMPVTLPDFAFPDLQIAIYCDGYEFHSEREAFQKDRHQSRELQLQGWCVLRFGGWEILNETDAVVRTIEQAIRRKARGREDQEKQPRMRELRQTLPIGGAFAAGLVAAVVLMILVESFFPTLFYHLTSGL